MKALAVIGRKATPKAASHSRIAFSSIASNTGARSPGEELMTCNTSAVAVCCSKASRVSVMSRAFSIAITAWSAKVRHQLDLPLGERLDPLAGEPDDADRLASSRNSGTPSIVRISPSARRFGRAASSGSEAVGDLDGLALSTARPIIVPRPGVKDCRRSNASYSRETAKPAAHPIFIAVSDRKSNPSRRGTVAGRFLQRVSSTGCEIEGRATDDLQHLGGRGLVLERFSSRVARAIRRAAAHSPSR